MPIMPEKEHCWQSALDASGCDVTKHSVQSCVLRVWLPCRSCGRRQRAIALPGGRPGRGYKRPKRVSRAHKREHGTLQNQLS